jgi:hypothetical protein
MFLIIIRRISVVLLVGLSLILSEQNLFPLTRRAENPEVLAARNEISIWENRFDTVRQGLPAGVDHVGYITEADLALPDGQQNSNSDQVNEFKMTRYVMAPVIVMQGVDYPWIIGNFSSNTRFKSWLQDKIGYYEMQEFSGGIYLIHKVQK